MLYPSSPVEVTQTDIGSEKNCGSIEIVGPKNLKNNLGLKKIVGAKKIESERNVGSAKILGPQKSFGRKLFGVQ